MESLPVAREGEKWGLSSAAAAIIMLWRDSTKFKRKKGREKISHGEIGNGSEM